MENSIKHAVQVISETIEKASLKSIEDIIYQLGSTVGHTERLLNRYQTETLMTRWKMIGIAVVTTIATCLLMVKLVLPKPVLTLTEQQLNTYQDGLLFQTFWPKLTDKQRETLMHIGMGLPKAKED